MKKDSKVLVLGSRGLVGSAISRALKEQGHTQVLCPTSSELDLTVQQATLDYFNDNRPEYIFLAAAKVGGIYANNTYPTEFILKNLQIETNVLDAAFQFNVEKLLFLGSSCIYPKECPQPIREEYLLSGPLEETNLPYAIAKIAGLKTAESMRRQYQRPFFSVMPTNIYGINDNFHEENSHVIPGLIGRMQKAKLRGDKEFKVWGTGLPRREFLYVDDLADACLFLMNHHGELPHWINVGSGTDITIKELASLVAKSLNFEGEISFDSSYPDGTMRKLLNIDKIKALGWQPKIGLQEGLKRTVNFYLENY